MSAMKIGWNLKTGTNLQLSSWRNTDDPSTGDFTFGMDVTGVNELYIKKGSQKIYCSGPWNGIYTSGAPDSKPNSIFTGSFI